MVEQCIYVVMYIIFWPAAGTLDRQYIRDEVAGIIIARHAANNAADADKIYGDADDILAPCAWTYTHTDGTETAVHRPASIVLRNMKLLPSDAVPAKEDNVVSA